MSFWEKGFRFAGEWISPHCCDACGSIREPDAVLCSDCLGLLRREEDPFCFRCGHPLRHVPEPGDYSACPNCRNRKFHFRLARSVFLNEGPVHELILKLKYARALHLAALFASCMREYVEHSPELKDVSWTVVCVPQSWMRRLKRGYNQAEEIAREVARGLGLPFLPLLRRSWRSRSQTALTRRRRLAANRNTVSIRRRYVKKTALQEARFLLIDDVLTTGATLEECARALKKNFPGADVVALTFLRSE